MQRDGEANPADFYDQLAPVYHQLYPDWAVACREQGDALHAVMSERLRRSPRLSAGRVRLLDAAVGIGTQLIGVAGHGYDVFGTDLSQQAIRRAQDECRQRAVPAVLGMADMRALPFAARSFDAVICADNAVAHLLSEAALTAALAELRRVTRVGGVVVVTIRDYEEARRLHPSGTLPQVATSPDGGRSVTVQVWDWRADGASYELQHLQLTQASHAWHVAHRTATFRAVTRDEVTRCAQRAGLAGVAWLLPAESGFFQPLMVADVRDARR